ncbi:MAG TPA: protoheme IX farnesyltransferase [Bacteroidetes bacterium]|nr:protoheme IX farnesyltransferase [Bacteroidota bacterium]
MQSNKSTYTLSLKDALFVRVRAYAQLVKMRLTLLVVFSAVFGYLMAPSVVGIDPMLLLLLGLSGFLITGASNTLNQVIEVEHDAKMKRTEGRPLVQGVISSLEAVIFAVISGVIGVAMLAIFFPGMIAALLGIIALLSYAFVYTPLKRVSSISVLVGAIPGAMPLLIGWAAATGGLSPVAWILFLIQFIWQFPHFWAIGWVCDEDYREAGFKMLPGDSGRSSFTASLVVIYTALLIPVSILPFSMGMIGSIGLGVMVLAGLGFTFLAFKLLITMQVKAASRVMFASFIYLPVVQILMLIEQF